MPGNEGILHGMDADPAVGDFCVSATAARHEDRSVLRAAVSSPLQATGLGLTARVERSDASTESGIWLVIKFAWCVGGHRPWLLGSTPFALACGNQDYRLKAEALERKNTIDHTFVQPDIPTKDFCHVSIPYSNVR